MTKRERLDTKRVNFFDGQKITESDLDTEQINNNALVSNMVIDFHGSGVIKDSPFQDKILLDTSHPGIYAIDENSSKLDLESGRFDGKGISLDLQPSDSIRGNRIEFELVNADVKGREKTKIMILGRTFDGLNSEGILTIEFLEFSTNMKKVSKNFYISILGIFFNNFSGGTGKNEIQSSVDSLDLISNSNGYMIIRESESLSVYPASIISEQIESPNYDLIHFISSSTSLSISDELEIALGSANSINDLYLEFDGKDTLAFEIDGDSSVAYGQKFLSKSNNIQKIDLLLSIVRDESLDTENQLNFSGDLILSIHELISETNCPTDEIPDDLINFDPEINSLVEVSFSQSDLEELGYKLTETPQVISFNFAGTLIADPNLEPSVSKNTYYAFMLSRRGDNRTGTVLVSQGYDKVDFKTNNDISLSVIEKFGKQESKFFQYDPSTKQYLNDSTSSLWYRIYSDTIEVVNGTAYTEQGIAVTVPKTIDFVGDTEISYFANNIPLRTVSEGEKNYLILSQKEEFSEANVHPRTHNQVFTRIKDVPEFAVVNQEELENLEEDVVPLILSKINDFNVRAAQTLSGVFEFPGLISQNEIQIINPANNILNANLINRIITPDISCDCNSKYRIIEVNCQDVKAGDFDDDGLLTSSDLSVLLSLTGNTINSRATEKRILNNEINIINFIKADLNEDGTVDGIDIELLEDAVDGYVNFTAPAEFKVLTLKLENVLDANDYPIIFTDVAATGTATSGSAIIEFVTVTSNQALMIRENDIITIPNGTSDPGSYLITSKTISDDEITVLVEVTSEDGSSIEFVGSAGFNVTVTSGTKVNIFADNPNIMNLPFEEFNYQISFIDAPFEERFIEICDLKRDVGTSFIELKNNDCQCEPADCSPSEECAPIYQNQTYLPGDLYLPNGNILQSPGVPHPGDFEYVNIKLPLPAGSINDCSLNLYTNFIKSQNGTCFTAAGFPALKYSDGSLVGCEDSGLDTDLTKGRVKIDYKIASLFVDSLTEEASDDGYVSVSEITFDSVESIAENSINYQYLTFDSWSEDSLNDTAIATITHSSGTVEPALFELTTSSNSGERFGRLNSPATIQNFTGDFIVDFLATRTTWNSETLTNGTVSYFSTLTITNDDGSIATLKLGWKVVGGYDTKIFYSGSIENSSSVVISTFNYEIDAPDSVGDEISFRLRRIDDVVFAYYLIPDQIVESTSTSFGQYVRIGENPEVQPGDGAVIISFEIAQESSPTLGILFLVKLSKIDVKYEYSADDETTVINIGLDSGTKETDKLIVTFPFNLPRRTSVTSAILKMVSQSTSVINDDYKITPIKLFNADNIGTVSNFYLETDESLIKEFVPGTIVAGETINVDITEIFSNILAEPSHLSGFIKGFVIEPKIDADSFFIINSDLEILVEYEDATTGIIFKVGISVDASTGIVTFNTKNILYDALNESNRTMVSFGVYLKKSGFKNSNLTLTTTDLSRLGIGTCFDRQVIEENGQCFYIVAGAGGGTFLEEFPCDS